MKIAYLGAGAAGMYCGMCLHDNTLAAALRQAGHDALLVPLYTPLRTDEENVSDGHIFYGGINVYLQQESALFRHTPRFIDALLDSPLVMRWLARRRAAVDPTQLGELTVSMLQGEHGRQRKELRRLVRWLARDVRPDVVHLSNAMLIAMADEIRRTLGVPIVCSLSGEDVFLERVLEPYYSQARKLLKQHAASADAYVALNRYYADFMIDYMQLDPARVHVIPHGLKLQGHGTRRPRRDDEPFTLGYFARVCPDKGLHLLVEAFRILCQDRRLPRLRLRAAGYLSPEDRLWLDEIQRHVRQWGLAEQFEYLGEPDRAGKIAILQSFDVMSVPTIYRESKGLSILEAWANAVPVVLPSHGAFPEMVADTGGGLLFEPENAAALADCIRHYIEHPDEAEEHQVKRLKALRKRRDGAKVERSLERLARAAETEGVNLMEPVLECVRAYATVGEMAGALMKVFGTYREPAEA